MSQPAFELPCDLPEIEVLEDPQLTSQQASILDLHSVLNVLNVLACEVQLLGLALEDNAEALPWSLWFCDRFTHLLTDRDEAITMAAELDHHADLVSSEVESAMRRNPKRALLPAAVNGRASIHSVLDIFRVRARELVARSEDPREWKPFAPETLRESLLDVFRAIQAHSRNRFGFWFGQGPRRPEEYAVELLFDGGGEPAIWMPPVFRDVIRDLVANARKYTAPGGQISVRLVQSPGELRLAVRDSGLGIPDEDIPAVVRFGHRGRNVQEMRTMGGGFGLTKAQWVARQFGGRFWIASRIGVGTRVRIVLPRPGTASA